MEAPRAVDRPTALRGVGSRAPAPLLRGRATGALPLHLSLEGSEYSGRTEQLPALGQLLFTLDELVSPVRWHVGQDLRRAAGPDDLNTRHAGRSA